MSCPISMTFNFANGSINSPKNTLMHSYLALSGLQLLFYDLSLELWEDYKPFFYNDLDPLLPYSTILGL